MHIIGQSIKSPECPCVLPIFLSYHRSTFRFFSPFLFLSTSPFPSPFTFPCLFLFRFFLSFSFSFPLSLQLSFPFTSRFPFPLPSLPFFLPLSTFFSFSLSLPLFLSFPFSLPPFFPFSFFLFHFPFPSLLFPFLFSFPFAFLFPFHYRFPFFFSPLPFSLSLLPSFFQCPRSSVQYLRRYISVSVPDGRTVTIDHP